jgi:FtsP/CotA-like multicopper oxidase with cupredoxin domain
MSTVVLERDGRLERHRIESRVLKGLVRAFSFALPLACAVGTWMVLLQLLEGAHTANAPGLLVQILRAVTIALPAVLLATSGALALSERLCSAARVGSHLRAATTSTLVGVGTAAVFAAWHPVHSWLFGGYVHYSGAELSPAGYLLRDGMLALAVALPVAAVIVLLAQRRSAAPRKANGLARGLTAAGATLGLALVGLGSIGLGGSAAAGAGALGACPANAPLRHFDVQAIDVRITLNRFGDNDPGGKMYVLSNRVSDVRTQEASRKVTTGLRNDAIQPLVIRANEGDCVEIAYTNNASGGAYGIHADGLSYDVASSGDQVGLNPSSAPVRGGSTTYHYYVPNDPTLEGAHLLRPGPGNRLAVAHGLFGSIVVEPRGSTWRGADGQALASGWEAMISPPSGSKAFREYTLLWHEIGNEQTGGAPYDKNGVPMPTIDKHTGAYRPGSRAINYRSEPFMRRMDRNADESQSYGTYAYGDPATPTPRAYLSDPTKFRILHAGSEMFHVFHMHGGGIRWRFNPAADKTFDYEKTGLDKTPKAQLSPSTRLDSQATGPGESYNLEIEGGAGGVQQGAGEFLFHCHIASHYASGMWAFWRVYDTNQPGFAALPDRNPLPNSVTSADLIGRTMPDGTKLTAANLDAWIRPQLPTQGVKQNAYDASVWNYAVDRSNPSAPLYLGEPEDTSAWEDDNNLVPGHPTAYPGDVFKTLPGETVARPVIQFDPTNGRIAFPLLRTHVGTRPPFSPNGHSGAPWLGENGDVTPPGTGPAPWTGRKDGICPTGSTVRHFNIVALDGLRLQVTRAGAVDPNGKVFVLAKDVDDVLAGRKPIEPLAIRANIGDCVAVIFTSLQHDANDFSGFSKSNIHIHHVQFDTQASDGVVTGMSYEQTVRPFQAEDPQITLDAAAGDTTLSLASVAKFQAGEWIAAGLGTDSVEVRQIASIDTGAKTVTLTKALENAHAAGQYAGVEFVQYRWYPDVQLDNIFWHTHVDGIHDWGHGLVGQLIIEPKGSTYHDPQTGAEVDSGTIVDIHTNRNPADERTELAPGLVDGSFREMALWTIDQNPAIESTLNLRAEPWADRLAHNGDSSLLFSSYAHGDPFTPLPRAYPGDPFVIRTINVSDGVDTLHVDGHRFWLENRYQDSDNSGGRAARPIDTIHYGISEKFSLIAKGGAGGPLAVPGDYLYMNAIGRRFRQGAWGIIRVLPGSSPSLQPLPDRAAPASTYTLPAETGGRPPEPADPGNPCPALAPQRSFDISAVDVPSSAFGNQLRAAFVPTNVARSVERKTLVPEPLVMHVAAGECVTVHFTNRRTVRASFHSTGLLSASAAGNSAYGAASSGIDVGFGPEQTVAPGGSRDYRLYADNAKLGATLISDFGGATVLPTSGGVPINVDTGSIGMYGAIDVAPAGATFTEPKSGGQVSIGAQVDVHVPGAASYRDFTVLMQDVDESIGQSHMPYPTEVKGISTINYGSGPRTTNDVNGAYSASGSGQNGTPATPILTAYVGDPVQVHALVTPGSEQMHVFGLGGESWPLDPFLDGSNQVQARAVGPWETLQANISGGAGGGTMVGDMFYGDLRRPFTSGGLWGIQRVLKDASCPIRPLDARGCTGSSDAYITLDATEPATLITHIIPAVGAAPVVGVKPAAPASPVRRTVLPPARGGHATRPRLAPDARCKPATRVAGHCSPKKVGMLLSDQVRPLPAPRAGR